MVALAGLSLMWVQAAHGNDSVIDLNTASGEEACGGLPISIVQMQWPSSVILAHIHGIILERQLGCEVQYVSGDMAAMASSMATTGEPAIAPELWISRIAPIWNSVLETGRIRTEAPSFSGAGFEGWFLPAHMRELVPQLKAASQIRDNLGLMIAKENGDEQSGSSGQDEQDDSAGADKVRFISCPKSWACSIINKNLLAAHGLSDLVELVEPANRFEMDTLIAQAVSLRLPIIFYYWQPNAVLAQFDFIALDMGEFNIENFKCLAQIDCSDAKPSSFGGERPYIVTSDWVSEDVPLVSRYLRRATMSIEEMNRVLNWQSEGEVDFEELAARFVAEREDVWHPWVEGLR